MHQSILHLEAFADSQSAGAYRTIFKTQHGRQIYLAVRVSSGNCTVTDCFYTDRNEGRSGPERRKSRPAKLVTLQMPLEQLLNVIESELDKKFYGLEFEENSTREMSAEDYISHNAALFPARYHFLIMEGSGEVVSELPSRMRSRLKNRLHRSVYLELEHYGDGRGVVRQCYYYDRAYLRQDIRVSPPMLVSCFLPYTREGILNLINHEICCNFTHIIFVSGADGIDLSSDDTPICGSI